MMVWYICRNLVTVLYCLQELSVKELREFSAKIFIYWFDV